MLIDFRKIISVGSQHINRDEKNNLIVKFSFILSFIYILIQFINSIFFFPENLGDEWFFTRDLIYYLDNGYYNSVIHGISIPFTLLSGSIYYFLNEISISLRLANSIIVFLLLIYLFFRKPLLRTNHKLIFTTHLFLLIGTTGGIFYGTNDSFFFVSVFILCAETYLYLKRHRVNILFLILIFSICILSRPHFIIYLPILFFSLYTILFFRDGLNIRNLFNPILISFFTSFLVVLLFNYPKLLENKFSHDQGTYLPKFLFFSYADKSGTYKTDDPDFNWVQWCFYSQMVSENKRFGLFASFVDWEEVREYKLKEDSQDLPDSYQEYILKYPAFILKRIPLSIIEICVFSLRYVGILLIFIPFWLIYRINKRSINSSIFIPTITFIGIISWSIIMPTSIPQHKFMPFYLMLIILLTNKNDLSSKHRKIITLNLFILNFCIVYAFVKWGLFRSL